YGTLTARETCADLIYFWGPKAERFARVRGIDVEYLRHPEDLLMHPDYPPLVPLLYGWGAMVAGELDFWGPLVLTAFLPAATALFVRATASDSGALTMAFVLAYAYAQSLAAGAADPMLVLFEVVALCALTFLRDRPGGVWVASVALAAAALTKVEGAAFAATALLSFLLVTRRVRQTAASALFPALALGSWIFFARAHGLLDSYLRGGSPLRLEAAPEVIGGLARASAYHIFFLPWIAALVPLLTRHPPLREAALPLMVTGGALAYTAFFYLHSPDPGAWITWSGERVLLTPLAAAVVAGAAAGRARAAPAVAGVPPAEQ
ncbi:MAG TPA: hypothetical protein VFL80_06565, partial [Thermoanaerobaculia bacterium]|nr:hypothetical protein [Thermoanaerobaculia bacterium]